MRQLLQEFGYPFPIEAHLVFINPNFQAYQAPADQPIIFPTQLSRFREKLKSRSGVLKASHRKLAKQLLSLHMEDNPYARIPEYQYGGLEKGILCPGCHTFYTTYKKTHLPCYECGGTEVNKTAIIRSIKELRLLFPEVKVTTNLVHDWCKIIKDKKTIRKTLSEHFIKMNHGKSSYYVNP